MQRQAEIHHFAVRLSECPEANVPEIALSGRSNVGKSTLINLLLRRKKLAYVSGAPGKTQTLTYYRIDGHWNLVDMPGYGYAKVPQRQRQRWRKSMEEFLRGREQLAGVLQLIDLGVGATAKDQERLDLLREIGLPLCIVFTKADKVPKTKREARATESLSALQLDPSTGVVLTSSLERLGVRELWSWVDEHLAADDR